MAKRTNLNPIGGSGVKGAVGAGPARSDLNSYPSATSGAGGGSTTINNINQTTVIEGDTNSYSYSGEKLPPHVETENYSGFSNPESVGLTYDGTARTVTFSGDFGMYVRGRQVYLPAGTITDAHAAEDGVWYLYYDPTDKLTWSKTTAWVFSKAPICVIWYSTSDKFGIRVAQGTNHWRTQQAHHEKIGAYWCSGGDISSVTLASYTAANRRPAVAECVVAVGETPTTNPALSAGTYTQALFTGTAAAPVADFVPSAGDVLPVTAGVAYYNAVSTSFSQAALAADEYGAVWLVAVPTTLDAGSQAYRYLWVQGQTHSTSLVVATAWGFNELNLIGLESLYAFVAVQKFLVRMNAAGDDWSVISITALEGDQYRSINPDARYLAAVAHDASLSGEGTEASDLILNVQHDTTLTGAGSEASPMAVGPHNQNASTIIIPDGVGSPTYSSVQDFLQTTRSSGRITGGVVTAHAGPNGTVDISEMEGLIFTTNALGGDYIFFKQAAATGGLALTDLAVNWVYFDFNAGTPRYLATVTRTDIHEYDQFVVARCWRSGNDVEVQPSGFGIYNLERRIFDRSILKYGLMDHISGAVVYKHATALRLASTAGSWYMDSIPFTTDAADTFFVWYKTGGGAWTKSAEITLFSDVFDGGASTVYTTYQDGTSLGALTANKYGVYWVYLCPEGELYLVMGNATYANVGLAQASAVPSSLPPYCVNWARLVGKVICQNAGAALYSVESVWVITFTQSGAVDHASLASLDYASAGHTGFQPAGTKITAIEALANAAGALTNNGAGVFSYVAYQPAGAYLTKMIKWRMRRGI